VQDDGDIEARAQEIFNKYKVNFGGEEKRLVIRCHADAVAAFNAKLDKIDTYIRSSYITINDVIGGGFRPGSIYLYAGLSGHGKSVFLCNHARDFIELGTSVLYVTTEMSQDDILTRVYQSLYSAKNIPDIMASDPKKIGVLDVVKIPPKDWTPLNIDELLERTDDKPDILIIDYADELLSDKISKSTYEEMGDVYAGLRRLAEKYNLPIITATQTNRSAADESGGTKEVFGQAAVADSAKKTHQVDVLMSIILTQKDRDENRIGLFVAKNRHGESGKKLTYRCDFEIMRIDDKPLSITLEESLSKDEEEQEECLKNLKRNMG
jgi:replicative DNA helicase